MTGPTQLNLFTSHITLDNEYMRCNHKRQEMMKIIAKKNYRIPENLILSGVPCRIQISSDNSGMHHGISRGAPNVD